MRPIINQFNYHTNHQSINPHVAKEHSHAESAPLLKLSFLFFHFPSFQPPSLRASAFLLALNIFHARNFRIESSTFSNSGTKKMRKNRDIVLKAIITH